MQADVQIELTNDEGHVDIVAGGFDAGIRLGERVHKDMIAVPIGGPISVAIVGSPAYFKEHPVPRHPSDLVHPLCVRFRFSGRWTPEPAPTAGQAEDVGGACARASCQAVRAVPHIDMRSSSSAHRPGPPMM